MDMETQTLEAQTGNAQGSDPTEVEVLPEEPPVVHNQEQCVGGNNHAADVANQIHMCAENGPIPDLNVQAECVLCKEPGSQNPLATTHETRQQNVTQNTHKCTRSWPTIAIGKENYTPT